MKDTKKTIMGGRRIAALSICTGCLLSGTTAMAAISYSYEDDNKTLVATVTGEDSTITTSSEIFENGFTNFVKRGDKDLYVQAGAGNSYTGDIRLDAGNLIFWDNAMGIDKTPGTITIDMGNFVLYGGTVAKDIACALDTGDRWGGRSVQVWEGRSANLTGKITVGNRRLYFYAFKSGNRRASLNIRGGIEDLADATGFAYFCAYGGSTFTISETPLNLKREIYFYKASWALDEVDGFIGHYVFSVAGNRMLGLGYDGPEETLIDRAEVKTTVDWAFDNASMSVSLGHDSVWDLCGTSQRIGTMKWRHRTGNMSVVTNSLATPATLHMGKFASYWFGDAAAPHILFGGNLSVVFEGDFITKVAYPMTASGDLTINGDGPNQSSTLAFQENGSWANATNVTVKGAGKITIANSNAFGSKANVNLAANSSLEIASGLTVKVKTLTVGGVQKPAGNYTFGSGTLSVSRPRGFMLSVQ